MRLTALVSFRSGNTAYRRAERAIGVSPQPMSDQDPDITIFEGRDSQHRSESPAGLGPPKQRFKDSAQRPPALQKSDGNRKGEKRSLRDLLEAAEAEVCSVIDEGISGSGSDTSAHLKGRLDTKNPRQVTCLRAFPCTCRAEQERFLLNHWINETFITIYIPLQFRPVSSLPCCDCRVC